MLLPTVIPACLLAWGPLQGMLRHFLGWEYGEYWFPDVHSIGGAIFILSFALYPYIFLLARQSFLSQSPYLMDVARVLGYSRIQIFFRVTLPAARPAIVAGLSLVLMETLADYGTVAYFGVNTFTTGIFHTWYGLDSINIAATLALLLFTFVLCLCMLEKILRRKMRFNLRSRHTQRLVPHHKGWCGGLLLFLTGLPLILGFIIPMVVLLGWIVTNSDVLIGRDYYILVRNTVLLALTTAIIAVMLAYISVYAYRLAASRTIKIANQITGLGYALPGTVIALGLLTPMSQLDQFIQKLFGVQWLLFSGTLITLVIAFLSRYMASALFTIEAAFAQISKGIDRTALVLSAGWRRLFWRVHIPLIRGSLVTATLIVFC